MQSLPYSSTVTLSIILKEKLLIHKHIVLFKELKYIKLYKAVLEGCLCVYINMVVIIYLQHL